MHPARKRLLEYGIVGLAIATAILAGLQFRPSGILPSEGILQVLVTDDPLTVTCHNPLQTISIVSLKVNISSIQAHRSGALDLTSEWVPVPNSPMTIDLVKLQTSAQLVASASLPPGKITDLRLNITSAVAKTSSGVTENLVVSSDPLKASLGPVGEVRSGMTTSVVADLHPHVICEVTGTFRLTPVLTATARAPQ